MFVHVLNVHLSGRKLYCNFKRVFLAFRSCKDVRSTDCIPLTIAMASTCFPDGIPAERQRKILTEDGMTALHLGDLFWKGEHSIFAEILRILMTEILGIETLLQKPLVLARTMHDTAMYQLSHCLPRNVTLPDGNVTDDETRCERSDLKLHAALGVQLSAGRPDEWLTFQSIQQSRLGGVIEDLGTSGFKTQDGVSVPKELQEEDLIALDFYKSYHVNQSYKEKIRSYFASMDEIAALKPWKCKNFYNNRKARPALCHKSICI